MKKTLLTIFSIFGFSIFLFGQLDSIPPDKLASWDSAAQWDNIDEESTAGIRKFTTNHIFCTPLVSYIPEHPTAPSPRDVLGHIAGAEGHLTSVAEEYRYLEALASASPRVVIKELGLTEEGRRIILIVIADEGTIQNLEQFKRYTSQLSDARSCNEKEANQIIKNAKPIMCINAGLHSPETGPPEMVMELAYRLAVSEHPDIVQIRENVITTIIPVMEPDGRDRVVEWYYKVLKDYDDRDYMPSRSPPYWGSHAYHDNNRDGIQMTLKLTQSYSDMFEEWHPQYGLDLHESVPLLYVSTGTGPYNEMVDPITVNEWQWFANWEISELNKHGLKGVWTWGFYTGWNPGYLVWIANNRNSIGRFYETFGNSVPKTMEREIEGRDMAGKSTTSRQWYRPDPPPEKVMWSLRNNTNYMQSGVLASLSLLARNKETVLYNFWKKGYNSWQNGKSTAPYAWIIPASQNAKDRTSYLVNQLLKHKIEVHRVVSDISLENDTIPAGDFLVRMDQPYGNHARNLLSDIIFPKDADYRPYDDVSWTLGKVYRVNTIPIKDKKIQDTDLQIELLTDEISIEANQTLNGSTVYVIPHDGSNSLISLRYALKDHQMYAADTSFSIDDRVFPAGSLILFTESEEENRITETINAHQLEIQGYSDLPHISKHELDLPRLALYHNWVSTQPDGWVRYSLSEAGVEYDYINDDDVREGNLQQRYDVIMMAHQGGRGSLKNMVLGRESRFGSQPYVKSEEFPSHGVIDESQDITGGMGFQGLTNLETFLNEGGTLILLGSAGQLATESGLLRNVSSGSGVNTPGSTIQTLVVWRDHPITYGFKDVNHVFRTNGPVYNVPDRFQHWIVVQYGTKLSDELKERVEVPKDAKGPLMITGYLSGENQLQQKGVVLDVPRNNGGRIILYSFNPLHRHLNIGDHNYVFNAILNWNDFPDPVPFGHKGLAKD